jgi:hypothetical protein
MISTELKKSYIDWINKRLDYKDLKEGAIEITTPFLDRHNDMLQIYAVPFENDKEEKRNLSYNIEWFAGLNI